jgi:hypothetical protein
MTAWTGNAKVCAAETNPILALGVGNSPAHEAQVGPLGMEMIGYLPIIGDIAFDQVKSREVSTQFRGRLKEPRCDCAPLLHPLPPHMAPLIVQYAAELAFGNHCIDQIVRRQRKRRERLTARALISWRLPGAIRPAMLPLPAR